MRRKFAEALVVGTVIGGLGLTGGADAARCGSRLRRHSEYRTEAERRIPGLLARGRRTAAGGTFATKRDARTFLATVTVDTMQGSTSPPTLAEGRSPTSPRSGERRRIGVRQRVLHSLLHSSGSPHGSAKGDRSTRSTSWRWRIFASRS